MYMSRERERERERDFWGKRGMNLGKFERINFYKGREEVQAVNFPGKKTTNRGNF